MNIPQLSLLSAARSIVHRAATAEESPENPLAEPSDFSSVNLDPAVVEGVVTGTVSSELLGEYTRFAAQVSSDLNGIPVTLTLEGGALGLKWKQPSFGLPTLAPVHSEAEVSPALVAEVKPTLGDAMFTSLGDERVAMLRGHFLGGEEFPGSALRVLGEGWKDAGGPWNKPSFELRPDPLGHFQRLSFDTEAQTMTLSTGAARFFELEVEGLMVKADGSVARAVSHAG